MGKEPMHIRLWNINLEAVKRYQKERGLNTSQAVNQMIRIALIVVRFVEFKGQAGWYEPPEKFIERTFLDEMSPEQREKFLRHFVGEHFFEKDSAKKKSNGGVDDIFWKDK